MFWYILGALILLTVQIVFACIFSGYAEDKGHSPKPYFWVCLFFGTVGYCMVAALPDLVVREQLDSICPKKRAKKVTVKEQSKEEPDPALIEKQLRESMEQDADEFIDMVLRMPTADLKLLLQDQQELYSEGELAVIQKVLSQRSDA